MRLIDADTLKKAIDDFPNCYNGWSDAYDKAFIIEAIEDVPTIDAIVATEEYEWCTECKEYDQEKHCCPRWNRFIRKTVEELEEYYKPKRGEWNFIGANMFECTSCKVTYTTQQLDGLRNYSTDPYAPKYCPNCGADMRGDDNESD